ncbi:MAG: hypothetical protein K6G10_04000 [Butyrivibrio sp.]|nr:hypothetical protein [Butyrivibrio sp.]
MFRMIIESDHEKLMREGKYSPEAFDTLVRDICLDTKFIEESKNIYTFGNENAALGRMIVLKAKFYKLGDIVPNLLKWTTFWEDEGEVDELAVARRHY